MDLQRSGSIIAFLGLAMLIGVVATSGYRATVNMNASGCAKALFDRQASDGKLRDETLIVLPNGSDELTFALPGSLCTALNRAKYFKEQRAKPNPGGVGEVALFIDEANTRLSKAVKLAPDEQQPDEWVMLDWKLRDAPPQEKGASASQPDVWKDMLSGASLSDGRRAVAIGVGDKTATAPAVSAAQTVQFLVFRPWMALIGAAGLLMIATGLVASNRDTGMLRDGSGAVAGGLSTFSLSKSQMALWLLLTVGGFVFLWVTTGRSSGIVTPEILTLLGIQGGSGLASVLIDQKETPGPSSGNFFRDILSDGVSVNLHRLQMLAWTLILAAIFLWSLVSTLSFPKFDTNLLILAGLSNGLYLGFKWPEPKT